MRLYEFMGKVGVTQEAMALYMHTSRTQVWRWRDHVLLREGDLVNPRVITTINFTDFNLDNLDDLKPFRK